MDVRPRLSLTLLLWFMVLIWLSPVRSHAAGAGDGLPKIAPAPEFTLTTQDNRQLSRQELHGKVVVVTFIYASCEDTCALLTAKLVPLQARLGPALGSQVFFLSVTVDPERDTPEVLKHYATTHGADLTGWAFLTGSPDAIRDVARRYKILYKKTPREDIDHTLRTYLVDQHGTLRAQYRGVRFDPEALWRDLQALLAEGARP